MLEIIVMRRILRVQQIFLHIAIHSSPACVGLRYCNIGCQRKETKDTILSCSVELLIHEMTKSRS